MITGKYSEFYNALRERVPKEKMMHDALRTIAFGTDASFYRLVPKLVVKASTPSEVKFILETACRMDIPLTFKAAGTSLSGQTISDSVIVLVSHGFTKHKILSGGKAIMLEPGIRGSIANAYLAKYGTKLGPDPASIDSAMIGGIASNNASGMSCGTQFNSYNTLADIDIILSDGTELDTSSEASCNAFKKSHKEMIARLEAISARIKGDAALKEKIERKYSIKNTTGYGLNSFTDYSDGIDIIKHLIIGSEGTLAFIANITFNTVEEFKHKALALIAFPDIKEACTAVESLKSQPISAAEIMDRAAIRSVENSDGIPDFLKGLPEGACGVLVETRSNDEELLKKQSAAITDCLKNFKTLHPFDFTEDAKEQAVLWKVRKEMLPTIAGMRKAGTTAIIEDICVPVARLADAAQDLREIFKKDGYPDTGIFGHSMAGNLHFMFNQDFTTDAEVRKYSKMLDDIAELIVTKYDGSLKAEHGTGRNMAPFVEKEWGKDAYSIMKEVKEIFDPKGIMNPGVIINADPHAHLKNLKPCPAVSETIDKCMECGFCERSCVAEGYTFSPRQRVASYREIRRLQMSGKEPHLAAEMMTGYKELGVNSCATDSLCAITCPVHVDTGKLTKELRHSFHTERGENNAVMIASRIGNLVWWARAAWNTTYYMRLAIGKKIFRLLALCARKVTGGLVPAWNPSYPAGGGKIPHSKLPEYQKHISAEGNLDALVEKDKVVYVPACINRMMGNSKGQKDALSLTKLTDSLLRRAGYEVIYPEGLKHLCCGMAFSSKGYVKAGKMLSDKMKEALMKASCNGKYPVLCDMSPCLYTMKSNFGDELKMYEPAEFTVKYLLPRVKIKKSDKTVAVFMVCTAKKLGVTDYIEEIARKCAKKVVIADANCCGFAGDKGFFLPELNRHGLRDLRRQVEGCDEGVATSRTCEIGLSDNSGISFKSILYLVDEAMENKSE